MEKIEITISLNEIDYERLETISFLLGMSSSEAAGFLLHHKLIELQKRGLINSETDISELET